MDKHLVIKICQKSNAIKEEEEEEEEGGGGVFSNTLLCLYRSHLKPIIMYAIVVWDKAFKYGINDSVGLIHLSGSAGTSTPLNGFDILHSVTYAPSPLSDTQVNGRVHHFFQLCTDFPKNSYKTPLPEPVKRKSTTKPFTLDTVRIYGQAVS